MNAGLRAHPSRLLHASDLRAAIEAAVTAAAAATLGRPPALVLAGSLARDEATFVETATGWRLLGDAEFMLFVPRRRELPLPARLQLCAQLAMARLREQGILAPIEVSACTQRYLTRMAPHQFGYELRRHGRVLVGNPRLLQAIPRFAPWQLPHEDAFRLLCNRLTEMLAFSPAELSGRAGDYARLKLVLDMATSFLIFHGQYASTYQRRADRLLRLCSSASRPEAPWDLDLFARQVEAATVWKLSLHGISEAPSPALSASELLMNAEKLWRWEAARLLQLPPQTSVEELLEAWSRRQPRLDCWRGWLWVARSAASPALRLHLWWRWGRLARRGSPRACVYQAALSCLFPPRPLPPGFLNRLAGLLPQPRYAVDPPALSPRRLARDVYWNYRRFLATTRY